MSIHGRLNEGNNYFQLFTFHMILASVAAVYESTFPPEGAQWKQLCEISYKNSLVMDYFQCRW